MTPAPPFVLESIKAHHAIADYRCSRDKDIERYVREQALQEHQAGICTVHVGIDVAAGSIVGFFTLSPLSIHVEERLLEQLGLPQVAYRGLGGYLLGRMGVDDRYAGKEHGEVLVALAVREARKARAITGGNYLAVDAKNDRLVKYYKRLGFKRIAQRRLVIRL